MCSSTCLFCKPGRNRTGNQPLGKGTLCPLSYGAMWRQSHYTQPARLFEVSNLYPGAKKWATGPHARGGDIARRQLHW